jgi:hypothetical protein
MRSRFLTALFVLVVGTVLAVPASAMAGGGSSASVVRSQVPLSGSQLTALELRIARQGHYWQARGVLLGRWAASAAADRVVIQLRTYTPAAARLLRDYYGPQRVSISSAPYRQRATLADRYYDYSPYYGGDPIFFHTHTPASFCTTSFTVVGTAGKIRGKKYALTAGHCGNRTWYTNYHHVDKLGKTAENALEGGVDAQIINGQEYADSVWGNGARAFRVVGLVTPKKGDKVTFSGAKTGEVNSIPVIDSAPFCANIDDIYVCGLIRAQSKHHTVCQSGDSGGPVFEIPRKKEARAVGIITAEGDSGRLCFYTELSYITHLMHVSVAVHK